MVTINRRHKPTKISSPHSVNEEYPFNSFQESTSRNPPLDYRPNKRYTALFSLLWGRRDQLQNPISKPITLSLVTRPWNPLESVEGDAGAPP